MARPQPRAPIARVAPQGSVATLEAMARLAAETGSVVHVVVERRPGVVEHARRAASASGLAVEADLRAHTVRVRFSPTPAADMT